MLAKAGHRAKAKLAFIGTPQNSETRKTLSQRGDHVGDGVFKGDSAIEVRLPILSKHAKIILPSALVETFANGIGDVSRSRTARRRAGIGVACIEGQRANHFTGRIKK